MPGTSFRHVRELWPISPHLPQRLRRVSTLFRRVGFSSSSRSLFTLEGVCGAKNLPYSTVSDPLLCSRFFVTRLRRERRLLASSRARFSSPRSAFFRIILVVLFAIRFRFAIISLGELLRWFLILFSIYPVWHRASIGLLGVLG